MNKFKAVCFDINETIIEENSWYDLNLALGITIEEDEKYFDQYHEGVISYEEWAEILLNFYKKSALANKEEITKIISRYSLKVGAKELLEYLRARDYKIVFISGGMDIMVAKVAAELGVAEYYSGSHFIFNKENRLESIKTFGEEADFKLNALKKFCTKHKIGLKDCVCIGDSQNDLLVFEETKNGITFKNCDLILQLSAWQTVNNLLEIKNIL